MKKNYSAALLGALCGTFLFAATAPGSATPLNGTLLQEDARPASLVQEISHTTAHGAKCLKWTRRWNHRHGFGHRRCVHWK
jgi:hypothetical protein